MSCPFKHLWVGTSEAQSSLGESNLNYGSQLQKASQANESNETPLEIHTSSTQRCPAGFSKDTSEANTDAQPRCPLGFGSESGPRLGVLHCIICKSLLFDCAVTNCGHRFCHACIARCKDCPVCGADVESISPDADTQTTVDTFLKAHSGNASLWEVEGTANKSDNIADSERSKAAFYLQVGLRALHGGNVVSAMSRLKESRNCLQADLDTIDKSMKKEEANDIRNKLGAVHGCLGDCARVNGSIAEALIEYQSSVDHLRHASNESNAEAAHALSVTLNKIAEVHHAGGDIKAALPLYLESLKVRRVLFRDRTLGGHDGDGTEKTAIGLGSNNGSGVLDPLMLGLDVVVGEIKVADACRAIGRHDDGQSHIHAAKEMLLPLEGRLSECGSAALRTKFAMVVEYLNR